MVKVYLHRGSLEIGAPPPVGADKLIAEIGHAESTDRLVVYYPESPDSVAGSFDALERTLFEMLSSALRAKLAP